MSSDTHWVCEGIRLADDRCRDAAELQMPQLWRRVGTAKLVRKLREAAHSANLHALDGASSPNKSERARLENVFQSARSSWENSLPVPRILTPNVKPGTDHGMIYRSRVDRRLGHSSRESAASNARIR